MFCKYCEKYRKVEEILVDRSTKIGYRNKCKECYTNKVKLSYKHSFQTYCKKCKKQVNTKYFSKNKYNLTGVSETCNYCKKQRIKERNRDNYLENKESVNKKSALYYLENKERIINKATKYYNDNKEKVIAYKSKWHRRKMHNKGSQKRYYNTNKSSKLSRQHMYNLKLLNRYIKEGKDAKLEILGITAKELKTHIESQFESWMNWGNRGVFGKIPEPNTSWDIDHIIPISLSSEEDLYSVVFHWSNLQPLCSYKNRITKRDRIIDICNIHFKKQIEYKNLYNNE